MNFYEVALEQARKQGHRVCGDFALYEKTQMHTMAVLCDGVGSGVYANIAAIACANRLMESVRAGASLRAAASRVAESMNRARTEEMPFSAFAALRVLPGGQFTCYAYENPGPILIRQGKAEALSERPIALKREIIHESTGTLAGGDTLLLCSDGLTHAGLGGGYATGWELSGVVSEINARMASGDDKRALLPRLLRTAKQLSGHTFWDDTTLLSLSCREARQLTLWTGPPQSRADDALMASLFDAAEGKKAICGSSTTEIASRELNREARIEAMGIELGSPPEYRMERVDLIAEGAVTLNQTLHLLEENVDLSLKDTVPFKLARLLTESDAVTFLLGTGANPGQEQDPLMRQLGVKPRRWVIGELETLLKEKGKLVAVKRF